MISIESKQYYIQFISLSFNLLVLIRYIGLLNFELTNDAKSKWYAKQVKV